MPETPSLQDTESQSPSSVDSSLIGWREVAKHLKLSKEEYSQKVASGEIPIALKESSQRWGRVNTKTYHRKRDIEALAGSVSAERLARTSHKHTSPTSGPAASSALLASPGADPSLTPPTFARESSATTGPSMTLESQLSSIAQKLSCFGPHVENRGSVISFEKRVELHMDAAHDEFGAAYPRHIRLTLKANVKSKPTQVLSETAFADILQSVAEHFSQGRIALLRAQLRKRVDELILEFDDAPSASRKTAFLKALSSDLLDGVHEKDLISRESFKRSRGSAVQQILAKLSRQRIARLMQLKNYPDAFTLARSLRRRLYFKLGPTNSGKTHEALEALKSASSGVYLAPLRLLAMEVRDRLMAEGIPCNLITGEEHDIVPGAQHTACTIEMMDLFKEVRVAVIDEIQMISDRQRGWAWTAAITGVPAREVFACGSGSVLPLYERILTQLDESVNIEHLERKTPLLVQDRALGSPSEHRGRARKRDARRNAPMPASNGVPSLARLEPGDALIAFSRREVLRLSQVYQQAGYKVSTLYGALPPEVRRLQAEKFASGESDIVISTDVIGMGLNLPIRRVVFSTGQKFDGEVVRPLNPTEVRQIAGRAGRFGRYDAGYVSALDSKTLAHIAKTLPAAEPQPSTIANVAPSMRHIQALSDLLESNAIGVLLQTFVEQAATHGTLFTPAPLEEAIELGFIVDRYYRHLALADKFTFACTPVDISREEDLNYFIRCLKAHRDGKALEAPKATRWLASGQSGYLEQAEELSRHLSLYAWLSFKFPETFVEQSAVAPLRARLSHYIENELGIAQSSTRKRSSRTMRK